MLSNLATQLELLEEEEEEQCDQSSSITYIQQESVEVRQQFEMQPKPKRRKQNSERELIVIDEEPTAIDELCVTNTKTFSTSNTTSSTSNFAKENFTSYCCICYSEMHSTGLHQIACLACGHLFGKSCIEKWLKMKHNCPKCFKKAEVSQIRLLFVENISVVDVSERESLKQEVENWKTKFELLEREKNVLEFRLKVLEEQNNSSSSNSTTENSHSNHSTEEYQLKETISVQNAKIFQYLDDKELLLFAFQNTKDKQCGIQKISLLNSNCRDAFMCHNSFIRDFKLSPHQMNHILTCSMDKSVKLSDVNNKKCVLSFNSNIFEQNTICSSCCFHSQNSNYIFSGTSNGSLYIFDIRNPSKYMLKVDCKEHNQKSEEQSFENRVIHSLDFLDTVGVLGGSLSHGIWLFEEAFTYQSQLLMNGKCTSLCVDKSDNRSTLATFKNQQQMTHKVFSVRKGSGRSSPNSKTNTVPMSTQVGSCVQIEVPAQQNSVAALPFVRNFLFQNSNHSKKILSIEDEMNKSCVKIWDLQTGGVDQVLGNPNQSQQPFHDAKAFHNNSLLGALRSNSFALFSSHSC